MIGADLKGIGGLMLGRRRDVRCAIAHSEGGILEVLRDVVVRRISAREWTAVSRDPGTVGEVLKLDLVPRRTFGSMWVRILDSRPIMIDSALQHELRLGVLAFDDLQPSDPSARRVS